MNKFLFIISAIFAVTFTSCEEDDSPILFSTTDNTDPQNVEIRYYSPDPSCVPRQYYIRTNRLKGELTLKCTSAQNLYFAEPRDNSRVHFGVTESGEIDLNTLVCENGIWSVSIIDKNSLKFVFQETPVNPDVEFAWDNSYLTVCAKEGKKVLETSIRVWRSLNDDSPVNY